MTEIPVSLYERLHAGHGQGFKPKRRRISEPG